MRPLKTGLDYFPVDTDMYDEDTIFLIRGEAGGVKGYGILMVLLQALYRNGGYYMKWGEREKLLFCQRKNIDNEDCENVVNAALKWGFFDKTKYKDYKILTSRGTQKRYFSAACKRQRVSCMQEYLLMPEETVVNDYKNLIISGDSTQSKVKESKVKHSNVVYLGENQYETLCFQYGRKEVDSKIEDIDNYCLSKGRRYKDYAATIRAWFKKDGVTPKSKPKVCPNGHYYTGDVCEECI